MNDKDVVARPSRQWWVVPGAMLLFSIKVAAICFGEGRSSPGPGTQMPAESSGPWPMALLPAAVALFMAATICFNRVIASPTGIRSRRFLRREICASWEEVTDYYARFNRDNLLVLRVETTAGVITLPPYWSGLDALKSIVEERATHAKARTWETFGARMRDLPRTFDYSLCGLVTSYPRVLVPILVMLIVVSVIALAKLPLAAGAIVLFPIVPLGIPVCIDLKRRSKQRLLVTPEGLEFSDGTKRVTAAWAEVIRLRSSFAKLLPTYTVETAHGDFEFSLLIRNLLPLLALLRSVTRRGSLPVELADESADTCPQSAARLEFRIGAILQSMKLAPAGLLFCLLFAFVLGCYRDGTLWPQEGPSMVLGAVIVFALWGVMARWFSRTRIMVRDDGLSKRELFGERFIRWNDVREYYLTGPVGGPMRAVVVGANGSIRFLLQITDRNILLEEIARRSTTSKTTHWEHRVTMF